ncbi:anthocyanidin 3-O-glucosyltransferase 2-like [Manihot esculenta]|uniref:Uncharacterized protein n=1 Tax=Manihot esculenta TaxID=3983 RepID=A0ACB7H1Y7_MANES|nr:anthocyanidin 3-O-glucosyltransferase 2-like [Manihot esculenta]KAG8646119.1 hypothetical protein MANES_10G127566v8 [Manihot esculenta]
MDKAQLVFVPTPGMGHLISAVELAKLLLSRDYRLSITVLIIDIPLLNSKLHNYLESLQDSSFVLSNRLRFIELPKDDPELSNFHSFFERQKPSVKEVVLKLTQAESNADSPRLVGFVLDMFCTPMMDLADEFGIPSYIFFASGAAFLELMLYVQKIHDDENFNPIEFKDSHTELIVPSLVNPFPTRILPSPILNKERFGQLLVLARKFRQAKGIIVNTFLELESSAIESFKVPPLYHVGPILEVKSDGTNTHPEIMQWRDDQPAGSVVFLCFGSMGSFSKDQLKEIAYALENSGHRFLWSIRRPPPPDKIASPTDYEDPREVLPEGFLERTVAVGKVIGWAPQVAVLAHPAIGGFVSHCGWNSVLESLWFGVPIATWPMYAEQQFNAFEMVVELGLAVEIDMGYRKESGLIVNSDKIERAIRNLMENSDEKRKKVTEMREKSKTALIDGGSSFISLGDFIKDAMEG